MTSSNSNNTVNTLHTPSNANSHIHINTNPFPFIPLNNNIMPSFPTMPILPPLPVIHSMPAIPITPLQLLPQPQTLAAGVQYFIHPSMPNTPMILVPNILMNINTNNAHNKPPSNNAKIRAILSKKKSGSKPLTNQETQILEAAVKSARQQFMSWYQQQAINPIQLQQLQLLRPPPIQTLTPKQMLAIQQQQQLQLQRQQILQLQAQRLQQQQQLLQQQILANNIYNNNNIIYSNNSTANLAQNNNINTPAPLDIDTYFALPKPLEFDNIFYNDDDKEDDDEAQDNGLMPLFFDDTNVDVHNLCFNIGLCGIGVLSYGGNHYNKSLKTETYNKCKRDNTYKLLGVTDNTNECCEWLIRDLMRSQSEFKSNIKQKCNVMITDIVNNSEYQPEHQRDVKNIVDQIKCAPNITRCLFRKNIYNEYCANNQIVEISHVDILRANIDLIEKCETDTNCNSKAADDEDVTLEFFNLCRCMEAHFNPCNDVETLTDISANSEIFYQTALKLRNNPNYFSIPGLPNKKHIKQNNNTNINNVNVTNRIINISNLTINTQPNSHNNQWQSFPYINSPGIQFINPTQSNITYPLHSYMPPVVPPSNINIANGNYISSPPATSKQQSHIKQIKIPNAASWHVGGL